MGRDRGRDRGEHEGRRREGSLERHCRNVVKEPHWEEPTSRQPRWYDSPSTRLGSGRDQMEERDREVAGGYRRRRREDFDRHSQGRYERRRDSYRRHSRSCSRSRSPSPKRRQRWRGQANDPDLVNRRRGRKGREREREREEDGHAPHSGSFARAEVSEPEGEEAQTTNLRETSWEPKQYHEEEAEAEEEEETNGYPLEQQCPGSNTNINRLEKEKVRVTGFDANQNLHPKKERPKPQASICKGPQLNPNRDREVEAKEEAQVETLPQREKISVDGGILWKAVYRPRDPGPWKRKAKA